MTTLSYLYPGQPADDRLTQFLAPDEHAKHERWLQAAQDRARPAALSTARQLVVELRGQSDKILHVSVERMVRISGHPDVYRDHLRSLFAAGLIAGGGADYDAIRLCLF